MIIKNWAVEIFAIFVGSWFSIGTNSAAARCIHDDSRVSVQLHWNNEGIYVCWHTSQNDSPVSFFNRSLF
jgi:hypothetical protein